ncbi:neuroglian-like isoform X2 [Diabrotica undecimpunctata]|uniref:neuroglian-like isoform X2 n=1 Tax=Diabrotica undecimpunctata TaxID=50387 RepID=UPI003B63D6A0
MANNYFVILSLYLGFAVSERISPPLIVKGPPSDELLFEVPEHKDDDSRPIILNCEAEGFPAPRYSWTKDGKPFNYQSYDDRISIQPGRGTLVIIKPVDEDYGQYQCFAKNEYGIATSNSVFLRRDKFDSFNVSAPTTVVGTEGKPFLISCNPPGGYPSPKLNWVYITNSGVMKSINSSRITVDPEGDLWFSNLTRIDDSNGEFFYACVAVLGVKREYKLLNRISLNVTPAEDFNYNRQPPTKQYVSQKNKVGLRGKSVEIFCIYGGTPLPQTVWRKNGQVLYSSDRIRQANYGKSLLINDVDFNDEGNYTCEVSNGVGEAQSHSIDLKLLASPYLITKPTNQDVAEGDSVELECKAGGIPESQVKWIHNGKPIEESLANPRRKVLNNTIIIEHLQKNDTGNYGCNVTNRLGYVYKEVYVNVLNGIPEIIEAPKDTKSVEKQNVRLPCKTFGSSKPTIRWFRDGIELTKGNFQIQPNGTLLIKDVHFEDSGSYTCYAANKFGNTSAVSQVEVKARTYIYKGPKDTEAVTGSSVTLQCSAIADNELKLEIIWLQNNEPLDFEQEPRFIKSPDNSLIILKVKELDSGTYKCLARTELDEASAEAFLIVQDIPNSPIIESVECYSRKATITWREVGDNRSPILYFIIQYSTQFSPDTWKDISRVSAWEYTWSIPLAPWNQYTFRILAVNKVGPSKPSVHSRDVCITPPEVPNKNPELVSGHGTKPDNLVISWDPLPKTEHAGPGFKYRVCFKQNIDGATYECTDIHNYSQNTYTVSNQPSFQQYKIKVIASNDIGDAEAEPIEVIGYSGESKPLEAPTNFTLLLVPDGRTGLFSWNPIPKESFRGHILGYKIEFWSDVSNLHKEIQVGNLSKALINSLDPYTRNYARIYAFNGVYNGPSSATLSFNMPEGKPGIIENLEAYPLGSTSFLIKWRPPNKPNGILRGYVVSWAKVDAYRIDKLNTTTILDPNITSTKLTNLLPDTRYRIYVSSTTNAGESQQFFIERTTSHVQSIKPSKPTFTWILIQRNSGVTARIRWLPAIDGNGGANFIAKCKKKYNSAWIQSIVETTKDWTDVNDLTGSDVYECLVTSLDEKSVYRTDSDIQEIDISKERSQHKIINEQEISSGDNNGILHKISSPVETTTTAPDDYDDYNIGNTNEEKRS